MRNVQLKTFAGNYDNFACYTINELDQLQALDPLDFKSRKKKNPKTKERQLVSILNYFLTFDIEAYTVIPDEFKQHEEIHRRTKKPIPLNIPRPWAYMYHWQAKIDNLVYYGHYWEDVFLFFEAISKRLQLNKNRRLICFIHNLGYESWWMLRWLKEKYGEIELFAVQPKKPIKIFIPALGIEFRCSYRLSNMSLQKAVENEKGTIHPKAAGDLDYTSLHLPSQELSDQEFGYAIADVVSLYEYIEQKLINESDDFFSMPITSTGYIRRVLRRNCLNDKDYKRIFYNTRLHADIYIMLLEAGRGGDTHANRYIIGKILHELDSLDAVSEYPYVLVTKLFPMSQFQYYGIVTNMAVLDYLINTYACIFRCVFKGLRIKKNQPSPYVSYSKSIGDVGQIRFDNGRVLSCEPDGGIALTITDIDYKLIREQYEWDEIAIADMHIAEYGYLPEQITSVIMDLFREKCKLAIQIEKLEALEDPTPQQLEELDNLKYLYAKKKNLLNGIFGCMYTRPVHGEIEIDDNFNYIEKPNIDTMKDEEKLQYFEEKLDEYYGSYNSFLSYAWGVWCTCRGREHLAKLIRATNKRNPEDPEKNNIFAYGDTDSSKCILGDPSVIEELNSEIKKECEQRGAYVDIEGRRFYMGIFEQETDDIHGKYEEFCTLGAKKYCYRDKKGLHTTIAGVNKKKAPAELETIENFRVGFTFEEAGGNTLFYNSIPTQKIEYMGESFTITNNVAMTDSTYTLGHTLDYGMLLFEIEVEEEYEI